MIAEQEMTINNQTNEINELKKEIKNGDDKVKKMEQSAVSMKNQFNRADAEITDLKRKIIDLQNQLNKER